MSVPQWNLFWNTILYTAAAIPAKILRETMLTNSALTRVCISRGPKLEKCREDTKRALKPAALRPTEQAGKGQSAGQSNRCLLQHSDLRVIDFFSVWSQGVDGLAKAMKGEKRGGGEKKGGKRKRVWKMEQEAQSSAGSCHLPSSLPPTVPGAASCDLQEDSNATSAPLASDSWLYLETFYCRDWNGLELE